MANKNPQNNALRHGLTSARVVLPQLGESVDEWEAFRQGWHDALQPRNGPERELADRIAGIAWRLRRAETYQARHAALLELPDPLGDALLLGASQGGDAPGTEKRRGELRWALRLVDSDNTEKARRYEISLERSLGRNLRLYRELRSLTAPNAAS